MSKKWWVVIIVIIVVLIGLWYSGVLYPKSTASTESAAAINSGMSGGMGKNNSNAALAQNYASLDSDIALVNTDMAALNASLSVKNATTTAGQFQKVASSMTKIGMKLQSRIANVVDSNTRASLQAKWNDMTVNISNMTSQSVTALSNAALLSSTNMTGLMKAQVQLQTAQSDMQTARNDIQSITQGGI